MPLRSYRDLVVWQRSMELAQEVYRLDRALPAAERSGLSDQLRRAACSIPSSIAEGYGREYRTEYVKHLSAAQGSLAELETLLMLAVRVEYFRPVDLLEAVRLSDETARMLTVMLRKLGSRRPAGAARKKEPSTDQVRGTSLVSGPSSKA